MQLEDLELVALLHAQQGLDDERRARIVAQLRSLVEGTHRGDVGLQHRGQLGLLGLGQAQDAVCGLAALVGIVAIQTVQAGAGVRVQHRKGGLLLEEVLQGGDQHGVLEHIGMVACMEGVAVTEHRRDGNQPRWRVDTHGGCKVARRWRLAARAAGDLRIGGMVRLRQFCIMAGFAAILWVPRRSLHPRLRGFLFEEAPTAEKGPPNLS